MEARTFVKKRTQDREVEVVVRQKTMKDGRSGMLEEDGE